ncbi:MAG TPA: hypothetical protein VFW50_45055 [Streptosporangiaceae bacterium]|nr:hypothetical protein [Streptosporangiaceae bacterium]
MTERQIAAGETACFPFAARTAYGVPSIHEFNVISDNPNFNPEWVRLRRSAGDSYGPNYTLEISPGAIGEIRTAAAAFTLCTGQAQQVLAYLRPVIVRLPAVVPEWLYRPAPASALETRTPPGVSASPRQGSIRPAFEPDLPSWPVPVLPGTAREQCATWAHAEIESHLMHRSQPIFATDPVTTHRLRAHAEGLP